MVDNERIKLTEETKSSLQRIQEFDASNLPRVEELGTQINFKDAIEPANRLIDLYKQLPLTVLEALPKDILYKIKNQANSDFKRFDEILKFESGMTKDQKENLVNQLTAAYDSAFKSLYDIISYSVRKSTDFEKLSREARAKVQEISDKASELTAFIETTSSQAQTVLETIRKTAEEQGVSQQAYYFKTEFENHSNRANYWLRASIWLTIALGAYALVALHSHLIPWLKPTDTFEAVQIGIAKILIFGTISFILGLAAKNFLAHQHNAVVNKHRQNALATYEALVKAAGDNANRDIVLTKASECIFTPQTTAFSKSDESDGKAQSILSVTPQILKHFSGS